jgi:hypothetical protein
MAVETSLSAEVTALGNALGRIIPGASEAVTLFKDLSSGAQGVYNAVAKNVDTVESYRIQLTKASGATSEFAEQIRKQTYALNEYGVSYKKVVEANVAIAESYSKATFSSAKTRQNFEEERETLQKLVTVNEKFGVGQRETIDLANKLTNSVFNNIGGVVKFSDTLLKFSKETGQPFSNTLREFGTYSERFVTAISSDAAIKSFTTLELLARRAGSSVSALVGSISKFDDIDEAFSSGGQINRVLSYFGGSLDTLAMASASEEEKAQMLLQSISSISEQFNAQMTDPNARRSVLKELTKQTGLDINTITGLLNKNNDLSKDLQSIIRTPTVTGIGPEIPAEEKKRMAMAVTSQAEVDEIKKENLYIGPLTFALERFQANQKSMIVETSRLVAGEVDKGFSKLLKTGDVPGMLTSFASAIDLTTKAFTKQGGFEQFQTALNRGLVPAVDSVAATFKKNLTTLDSDKYQENLNKHAEKLQQIDKTRREEDSKRHAKAAEDGVIKGMATARSNEKPKEVSINVRLIDKEGRQVGVSNLIAQV